MAVSAIYHKKQKCLYLGNLDAKRDWGHAKDFVKGMWLILKQKKPNDFVLATGETNTVRKFVELAFKEVGIEVSWEGKGINEVGRNSKNGAIIVRVDKKYFRPAEVDILLGDYTKAKKQLKWSPTVSFNQLVKEMVLSEMKKYS